MFSKSLLKLIDEAILPAVLIIAVRLITLLFVCEVASYSVFFYWQKSIFPLKIVFNSSPQELIANTISFLGAYLVVLFGFGWILVKAELFHESHIHPKMIARLAQESLLNLVKGSFDLYHKALVWFIFLWILTFLAFIQVLKGEMIIWVSFVIAVFTLFASSLLIDDIEREFKILKPQNL